MMSRLKAIIKKETRVKLRKGFCTLGNNKNINLNNFLSKFIAVLGQRGSGKSNTVRVILEELLENKVAFLIIDIEGEYYTLADNYEDITIYNHKDLNDRTAISFIKNSMINNKPIIFDIKLIPRVTYNRIIYATMKFFWNLKLHNKIPYLIIVEECHNFFPQQAQDADIKYIREVFRDMARQGRKLGVGCIFVTQRPHLVHKDIITQSEERYLHRVNYPNDLEVYCEIMPYSRKDIYNTVPKLYAGEVIYVNDKGQADRFKVRLGHTRHVSETPDITYLKDYNEYINYNGESDEDNIVSEDEAVDSKKSEDKIYSVEEMKKLEKKKLIDDWKKKMNEKKKNK